LWIDLLSARIDGSVARAQQVATAAARVNLVGLALEAQLALIVMKPAALRQPDAKKLADEASQKGFGLIARKASALASPPRVKT
jgi:hypothetical protein